MMERVPEWQASSEADFDQVLLELFSAAADELSDYQDRVMNEAYLATCRKRVSLARHARLMDYHIHQGNQAGTWLALELDHMNVATSYDLADGLRVWSGRKTEDEESVVFISRDEEDPKPRVNQLLNSMSLYTWSDSIPALAAGSTQADLKLFVAFYPDLDVPEMVPATDQVSAQTVEALIRSGRVTRLLIQERLNPTTGLAAGRDPSKRQLLHLLPGDDGAEALLDPITNEWFVRVRWEQEDALQRSYCFTIECDAPVGKVENITLFHGNLVEVFHGRPQSIIFKDETQQLTADNQYYYERTERWGTICRLPGTSLAYRNTPPGGEVAPLSTLDVRVADKGGGAPDRWNEVPNLIHSDTSDENGDHFIVETDETRHSLIRFGSIAGGENGKELPEEATVFCTYQTGDGLEGNIGADMLTNFKAATLVSNPAKVAISKCWNPFDITNGRAPEPAAEIIRRVPEAFRARQLRAVTLQDYVKRAEEVPEVSRAAASYAWTGSWRTVRLTIDPRGMNTLEEKTRRKVARYLEAVRLIGEDIEIRPPRFIPLDIKVVLCAAPAQWPEDLQFALDEEFSNGWTSDGRRGFFHPDLWTFGQPLYASQIIGRAMQIEGVEHVVSVSIKRWNDPTAAADYYGNLRPSEIIQVLNDPDHMESGFISFEIKGGRG
ncbi:MAG: baseplate J/gp47 family protein, partial [Acidobacteria bacterium]|nr:baseplate J/gp47 family protein [Acidobacteriota bacterium]